MQLYIPSLLALTGLLTLTAAAPASEKGPECIVPAVYYSTLENPFSLDALVPASSTPTQQDSWFILLDPRDPTKKVQSAPVLSHTKIAPPSFRLDNGTLLTVDGGFPARLSPTIQIFPPVLQPFVFGGPFPSNSEAKFGAIYSCDSTGRPFLKLVTEDGMKLLCFLVSVSCFHLLSFFSPPQPSNPTPPISRNSWYQSVLGARIQSRGTAAILECIKY